MPVKETGRSESLCRPTNAALIKMGQKTAFAATAATLILALAKLVVGYGCGSQLLIADGLHSSADLLAIFASGFGLWLANKGKSERFPYGLYRAETLASLLIGIVILYGGAEIAIDGFKCLFRQGPASAFHMLPLIVTVASAGVTLLIALRERAVGKQINSRSLLANSAESFLDICISFVVMAGLLLSALQILYVEGIAIIVIALLIIRLGWLTSWRAVLELLDANLDPGLRTSLIHQIRSTEGVREVDDIRIRQAGPFKWVDISLSTDPSLPLHRIQELMARVINRVKDAHGFIEDVAVHLNPPKKSSLSLIIPIENDDGLDSKVCGPFGKASFIAVVQVKDDTIEQIQIRENEFINSGRLKGVLLAKTISEWGCDLLFTSTIGDLPLFLLTQSYMAVYSSRGGRTVRELTEKYRRQELQRITGPTHFVGTSHNAHMGEIE
jgi:cation diffusion facilitator family transporter